MVEVSKAERSLPKEQLETEAYSLFGDYKSVLMRAPLFQRAAAIYVLGASMPGLADPKKEVEFGLTSEYRLTVKHAPNRSLSVELRGHDDVTKVIFKPEEPLVEWSYINDDGRRKERIYRNTREAIGNSHQLLDYLRVHLSSE